MKTENAQPAILAASCAIMSVINARLPLEKHVSYALGHSLGEFAALKASGILKFEDAVRLVRLRGEAMAKAVQEFGQETAMYALVVEKGRSTLLIDAVEQFSDDYANEDDVVAVANHNSVTPLDAVLTVVLPSGDIGDKRCLVEMLGSFTDFLRT